MLKRAFYLILLGSFFLLTSGCALLSTAIGSGIAYGIYKATSR